jgi:hypothetical protein
MSPELETLDQLLGGALPLAVIRNFYPDADAFRMGVFRLLTSGDVCLLTNDHADVPSWRWRELFLDGAVMKELASMNLKITAQGTHRIA